MGIYGISKLSILSGILFLILQIGAADKPSPSSDTARSSTTKLRQEAPQEASAIHTATHLFSQKTQSSLKGAEHVLSNDDTLQAIDNDRLRQLQDEISDIYHRKSSSASTAATPEELLTEIPRYLTKATSASKEYVTETDVRANFGTTVSVETLTKVDTNLQTTTSSETLTEVDPTYLLSATTSAAEILTESPSISSSGWTTKQAEILTVSSATHQPDGEDLATEAASKSRTTVAIHSELITEGVEETEASTVVPAASDHVTIADTTDSGVLQSDFSIGRTSRTKESVIGGDDEEFTTRDEAVIDSTSPPIPVAFVLPVGEVSSPEENDADVVDDDDNAVHVIERPIPATDGPSSANNIGDMPYQPQTTPNTLSDTPEEDHGELEWGLSPKVTRKAKEDETTTYDDVVYVISMTTDEVTTVRSSTEYELKVSTERISEATTAETLEEKLSGFFRCTDGTLINIASLCDKKADCPDYSDEDSCNADEKENLTKQIHRPSLNWNEVAAKGSRDDILISLDDSRLAGVVEMEQSRTEAPTTFRCEEGGNVIPITAVCDKRADCLDFSDEYNCDGTKHVTEATTTMDTITKLSSLKPKFESSPTIEVLNEDDEEIEFFRCLDGSAVVPMRAVCDKKWDCLDFSDEDECDAKGKLPIAKANKTKPGMSWATPQTPADLPDREKNMIVQEMPDAKGTLPEFWLCENGNYIFISSVCDKKDDCGDFSDEDDCTGNRKIPTTEAPDIALLVTTPSPLSNLSERGTLAMTTLMSTTVQSTPASLTLFHADEVKSWSQGVTPSMNIMEEKYPVAMFQCDDGQEIEAIKVCDHNVDCYDGSDEDDCYDGWSEEPNARLRFAREAGSGTGPTPIVCGVGFFQCNDDSCINETLTCNGESDCLDGEDEDPATVCIGACDFPILNDRVVLATGTPSRALYLNGTVLVLDCILGSVLTGDSSITCLDGSFSAGPMCLRNCHTDLNRTALTCSSDVYTHGSNTNCNCESGYELEIANENIACSDSLLLPTHPQCRETNECLLSPTPCDPLASCFNMPLGSFTCICDLGYMGNGTYCEDIDECSLGADCDRNATCTNTAGSYTCECNNGFVGDGFKCIEQIYYNYGPAAGDTSIDSTSGVARKRRAGVTGNINGYIVSEPIRRRQFLPIGEQLYQYIYITNSGVIAFNNDPSVDLSEFSHPSGFTTSSSTMPAVSVFGSEAEISSTVDSNVYYHVYENSATTDEITTELLGKVSNQVNNAVLSGGTSILQYEPKWAMVITWVKLRRFGTLESTTETDTFQAVLTTDGSKTYIVQLYQEGSMLWDANQLNSAVVPVIGYRTSDSFFDLQTSESYTRTMMFRPDGLAGNILTFGSSRNGRFVFRLDLNSDSFVNPAEYCQDWYDSPDTYTASRNVRGVLPCPCTLQQAASDFRFTACTSYVPINQFAFGGASIDPYPSYLENSNQCMQQVFPSFQFSGSRCIYNHSDSLVVGYDSMWESSHLQGTLPFARSPFSIFYLRWILDDVLPRHFCCSQSPDAYYCNLYETRRPPRTCNGYRAVSQAWGRGDPHITTLDTFEYTFNGLGEYWLIMIDSIGFKLQGRTEKAFNSSGMEVDTGTVFTAFGVSQGATTVQFELNADRTNMSILINGSIMIDPVDLQTTGYNSSDSMFNIRYNSAGVEGVTGARYIATFRDSTSGEDVTVNVGISLRMLDFIFQAPEAYKDGSTRGLYGVWDGNMANELTRPNGTILSNPESRTEQELFAYGELWRVPDGDTLFTYQSPDVYSTFNGNGFQPIYLSSLNQSADPALRAEAMANCGEDTSCLFDALATQDVSIGTNTMMIGMSRNQQVVDLENYPPILSNVTEMNPDALNPGINADGILTLIVNQSYTFQATAMDSNPDDVVTYSLEGNVPSSAVIEPDTGIFTWTPANLDQVLIGIQATDNQLASRYLQLLIIVCNCENGGTCDFDSMMEGNSLNNDKFSVAQCRCATGYAGLFCQDDYDSCELNPCYPGVTCIDNPPPSIEATCADCPLSLTGDGFQCWDLDECAEEVDGCDQLCINSVGSFSCDCNTGYDLQPNLKDCIDINECDRGTDICDENADCFNNNGSYTCECTDGYVLQADNRTCTDYDECTDTDPCDVNADCGNVVGSYTCTCRSGYQGDGRECKDYNECFNPDDNDCSEFASCENADGYYVCLCLEGYEGSGLTCTDRNECLEGVSQCSLEATCQNVPGSFMCSCDVGYTGDGNTCVDIDECADSLSNDCDENALCTNSLGSFSCACNAGFDGNGTTCTDIDECMSGAAVCASTATCTNTLGSYICSCFDGYRGDGFSCSDIDECSEQIDNCTQDCNNVDGSFSCSCIPGFELDADGATCNIAAQMACSPAIDPCTGSATCLNATNSITCTCQRGFFNFNDTHCQDIDECTAMTDNCDSSVGVCTNTEGGYTCSCAEGYMLAADERTCSNINECETGNNNCSSDAICDDLPGTFNCTCSPGYSGDGVTCTNINECDMSPCVVDSVCTDTLGSYMCSCAPGYVGDQISGCEDMDECIGMPCDVNGNCTNTPGSYTCACLAGFTGNGTHCQDILECNDPNRCVANSDCMELEGSYTCVCVSGYRGDGTEDCVDVDECLEDSTICHRRATCTNTDGSYNCSCNAGYVGDGTSCSNINECELGNIDCDVNSNCSDTDGSYTCYCIDGYFDSTGGRAAAGQCIDVDECALGVDACDANSVCLNNNGSYTCVCNDGYMSVSQTTCTDILECSQSPDPCNRPAFEICIEREGGYECACQSSTYRVGDACIMATTLFLTAQFIDIQGLVVEYYFDALNNDAERDGLANDTMDVLMASASFSDILDVSVQSMRLLDGGIIAEVIFRVDILITNTATENDLAMEFDNGLTGTRKDILAPNNRVYVQADIDVDPNECSNASICPSLSMCINTVGSYSCKCFEGYAFTDNNNNTCADLDECGQNICSVDSNCTNSIGSFTCVCDMGFTGDGITCTDDDECQMVDICGINTDCTNLPGSYNCSCASGYTGTPPMCEDIDECVADNDCGINSMCNNTAGSYQCSCNMGYMGSPPGSLCQDIDECVALNNCGNNSMCNNTAGSYQCFCNMGYMGSPPGSLCQDTDECAQQTDKCSQECVNTVGSYECTCNPGFELDADGFTCNDIDECVALNNCGNNSMCNNTAGSYQCFCNVGYIGSPPGSLCQDTDECAQQTDKCSQECVNTVGSYECTCNPGFELDADGFTCNVAPGMECSAVLDPCTGGGMCINATGLITCTCPRGFYNVSDTHCQDIDECTDMTDNCDRLVGTCTNSPGSYNCSCSNGYMLASDERTCSDIDECTDMTDNCDDLVGVCTNTAGGYNCSCTDGYMLDSDQSTCLDIDECVALNNCGNNSMCNNTAGSYQCFCNMGYMGSPPGSLCQDIDECTDMTDNCDDSVGVCTNTAGGYNCSCTDGYMLDSDQSTCSDVEECMLETSCSGENEGCTELQPGFECYCTNSSIRYEGMCLYSTRLEGSFRYNRINGDRVTYSPALANTDSAEFLNMTEITCNVFMYQIDLWVNVDVPYTYIECNITAFRPGSIIVDFIIDIYGTSQMEAMMRAQITSDNGFQGSPSNWTGNYYTIYVEELIYNNLCEPTTCENGGTCLYNVTANTTSCSCPPGFGGPVCENKVACESHTCQNGGVCQVDIMGDPYCECPAQYTGTFCEIPVSCENLDCQNNSTCEVDSNGVASCICTDGYEGIRCQLESTPGLSTGVIVGIILGVVGFVLLVVVLCFCCIIVFAARRRQQRKRELLEGAENWGYGGRRYAPAVAVSASSTAPSRGAVVRNDPAEFASESSDNFYYYQNSRGRPFGAAAAASAPSARPMFNLEDDEDDDTIDSRFSGIIRNMWNMHADQRPEASFDPRELPSTSNFMAGGIPRASVQPRNLYPEYHNAGFERPYVADGTESNAYSEETEEFRTYRGRGREKSRGPMDAYNYF